MSPALAVNDVVKIKLKSLLSQVVCHQLCDVEFIIYNMKTSKRNFHWLELL